MKWIGILLLISTRTEFQPKNLHLPARWGWGYGPSLDICTVDLQSQTPYSSQLSHLTALCTAVLREQSQVLPETQIVQALHILSSDPSIQGTLCCWVWGRRTLLLSSWLNEKASPRPPSTSCNAPYTKVIYHYKLDRSSVHSTALCHASLTDTMPKMTSFNSSLVNKRAFATLKQSWVFNSC